jgi:hypothetical protein
MQGLQSVYLTILLQVRYVTLRLSWWLEVLALINAVTVYTRLDALIFLCPTSTPYTDSFMIDRRSNTIPP